MPKFNRNQVKAREVYAHYKKNNIVGKPLSYKQHREVNKLFGELASEQLLKGKKVKFFHGLASIEIFKRICRTYVDKLESKKQGKRVLGSNAHSGFFRAYLHWRKNYVTCNSAGWAFRVSRSLAKKINAVMERPGGHKTFMEKMRTATETTAKMLYRKNVVKL